LTKIFGVRRDDKNNMKLDQSWRIIIELYFRFTGTYLHGDELLGERR
jgi:hypothetical protein